MNHIIMSNYPVPRGTHSGGNHVHVNPRRRVRLTASLLCLALAAAACGDDDEGADATATTTEAATDTTAASGTEGEAGGDADAALEELVAAAQEEGSVTVYSSQGLDQLNALGAAFEEEYGVDVEVVRATDADIIPRVETELQTGTSGGDLVVTAAQAFMETHAAAGDFVDPTASPQLAGLGDYDADQYMHDGNIFEVGAAILTFGWNTDLVPDGLTDYPDLLDPSLAGGKVGVPDPAIGPALVDFYLWLEEEFGEQFVADLAAQEPRIYPSSLPMGEALQSGEIFAGAFTAPVQLVPAARRRRPGRLRDLRGGRRLGRPLLRRHPHVVGQPERRGAAWPTSW